ncbi:hypothetical protein PUMCH_001355 [Australozyma saopauloensis]|uniref:Plus3 domain-containing protein n=1 Tax=Australozyma saopauloensis TaxID=291208 RepID=A0AAX4H776_9ASCO|nr:hypothetical protein PUMCH_001355 [[Candida] saopauloensis]
MSDLDDDLLALAGADSGSEENMLDVPLKRAKTDNSGRKRAKTSSEDAADENDDAEEEEEDEDDYEPQDHVTVEQDSEDAASDDDEGEHDLINPYPLEGKYKDEADRELLLEMDEIEREQTLFDRSQEMDRYNEKKYLQQRMKQQRQQGVEKKTRSSSRNIEKSSLRNSKLDKLSELRKQREKKSRRNDGDDYRDDEDEEEEDDQDEQEDDDQYDPDDIKGYGEESVVWGSGKSRFKPKSFEKATARHINNIRVGRSFLSKFLYYRDFADAVEHTFGKINVGVDRRTRNPIYRAVQIEQVVTHPHKPYKLNGNKTDMYLLVSQNSNQKKEFPLNIFSDSDITEEEFERYLAELAKTNEQAPYVDSVTEKAEQLHKLMNSGLSSKDIDEMVERKKELNGGIRSYDAVYQKSKVMDEIRVAKQENDVERVKVLREKLRSLEAVLYKENERSSQSSSASMSKVNERNRKLNLTNIRKAEVKSSVLRKTADAVDGDPFSRLKTTTRIFYQDLVNEENQKALQDARDNFDNLMAEKNEREERIASSTYRVLGYFDKLISQVDVDFVPVNI